MAANKLQNIRGVPARIHEEGPPPFIPEKIAVRPELAQRETFVLHRPPAYSEGSAKVCALIMSPGKRTF